MKSFPVGLSALLIRLLTATLRMTLVDHGGILHPGARRPVIVAFWHNRTFLMAPFYERYCSRRHTALTIISRSRDGQFMSDVAARFGVKSARGSSSRHGVAAALAARHAARDETVDIVITPDGPRGPRYRVQPGILRMARATGRPIVTVTTYLTWKRVLKSWDRFQVPLPFSRCELVTGEPIFVPPEASEEEMAAIGERVAASLGGD
jgi:lysophospholipid acyltransferase (LPLAT)-like uncharacterized protein